MNNKSLKIVNADIQDADPKDYPGFVQVRPSTGVGSPFCGGVKIARNVVITAAHCVHGRRASQLRLVMNLSRSSAYGYNRQTSTVVPITQIVIHPSYNSRTFVNDIAILFFAPTRATDTQSTASICPPSPGVNFFSRGYPVTITGYGTTRSGGPTSRTLRAASIHIMSISDSMYPPASQHAGNFLAGDYEDPNNPTDNQDTCQGDSGGPVYARDMNNAIHVIGLTSWGSGCAFDHYPGFYTNVCFYRNWIKTIVDRIRQQTPRIML